MEMQMASRTPKDTTVARVSVLESQVETINSSVVRLEQKVESSYAILHSRISDLRDDVRLELDNKHEKLIEKLEEQSRSSTAQHKVIHDKIEKINEQVEGLNQWKWMLVGGSTVLAAVFGYVFASVDLSVIFQ